MRKPLLKGAVMLGLGVCLAACQQKTPVNQASQATVAVTTISAVMQPVDVKYRSVGSLANKIAPTVRAQISGHVEQILVHEGDQVTQGQVLMQLSQKNETVAVEQAEADYLKAQAALTQKQQTYDSMAPLAKDQIIARNQFEQVTADYKSAQADAKAAHASLMEAQYNLARTKVESFIKGSVQKILVSEGDSVQPGTALLTLVGQGNMRVRLPFAESKANYLSPGQKVVLTSVTTPDQSLNTTVYSVTPGVNTDTRAVYAIVSFPNTPGWRHGASVHGTVIAENAFEGVVVPTSSIVLRPPIGPVAFVVVNGKAQQRAVQIGYQGEGWLAVVNGLHAGDEVVIDGADYLSNGVPVTATLVANPVANKG